MKQLLKLFAVAALVSTTAIAGPEDNLRENLQKMLPEGMEIKSIAESPMPGVYDVQAGHQSLYVYSQDEFLMIGDVYNVERRVSLGDEKKNEKINAALSDVPESEMIVMGDLESERYVTVFTDTDCGFCQRFHRTIPDLAKGGMKVRYMMFPRAGLNSKSYEEAVSVWCAADQGRAMTIAKTGGRVESATCENPVAAQYKLGQEIGIRGTPTMVLDTGRIIPGFVPADNLLTQAGMR
ncbi:MAG: DsbC family protein [Pseudomonadota bacterium]